MKLVKSWVVRAPYSGLLLGGVALIFAACATAAPGEEESGEKTGEGVSASHVFPPGLPQACLPPSGEILNIDKLCLAALPGELENGAPLFLSDRRRCAPAWSLLDSGEILGPGGMCLDAAWGHITDGTAVRMWECNGTDSQRWRLTHEGTIVGPGDKCLSSRFSGSPDESALELQCCDGAPNQQWYFHPV